LLVRFARRLANWEAHLSVGELQRREFKDRDGGPDLRPSVYELDAGHEAVVRAYAEHATAFDPPGTALGIDVTDPPRETIPTPSTADFAFTRERHREIKLNDLAELHALIRDVLANLDERRRPVTKREAVAYARLQLERGDEEWQRAVASPDAKPWLVKLRDSG
jgi:hypothetical protein